MRYSDQPLRLRVRLKKSNGVSREMGIEGGGGRAPVQMAMRSRLRRLR